MRQLRFNFAPKRGEAYVSYAFLAASILLASYVGWLYVTVATAQTSADARLTKLGVASSGVLHPSDRGHMTPSESNDDVNYERSVSDQLAVPWDDLFKEIELSVDDEVILLGVESDSVRGTVSFVAEARSLTAMIAYARRLRAGKLLHDIEIKNHKIITQDSLRPVRFVIHSRLRPRVQVQPTTSAQPG
ncbi:hypothetical protein LXA47_08350 [Massilia sp. P8910]|uniref:hypothetical protein n=1 Tax=Massilia antarctica TaxID=2765360 RepID=UPI001E52BBDA|nr:hypothetical protein [Massilia antarctica]MCE3603616.1 hypothetical protein [Massilia antarctica]